MQGEGVPPGLAVTSLSIEEMLALRGSGGHRHRDFRDRVR